ncbi:hypothetical protein [Streptomyces millisiae]|uniref:PPM-type phosphatase domain-containing protein n=1 Tax=Streptomyces millisiae TaxID=3075542 RepID=A0ABU2LWE5_9ACTN|nr:hypothetical protein [Streptomyces sp. DSM 44918]MDT0321860.1 hypothetical protein [Streptomyces sp. DSM 44918]
MHGWTVAEQAATPKQPAGHGEDRLVLVNDEGEGVRCAAVVDGATSKDTRTYGDQTGGARAAECVAEVLRRLPPNVAPTEALTMVTKELSALRRQWSIAPDDLMAPSAVAAVFLPGRRQVWRVGDVHIAIRTPNGWAHHPADKAIDRVVAAARAALLRCRLAQGASIDELAATDPGRTMLLPILKEQNVLANDTDPHNPLGFGVLDGRPVPDRYLETISLPPDAIEVVLASDGYLSAAPTLREAEDQLTLSLAEDPLRIGAYASTKATPPGARSFDDRTYIRLRLRRQGTETLDRPR